MEQSTIITYNVIKKIELDALYPYKRKHVIVVMCTFIQIKRKFYYST